MATIKVACPKCGQKVSGDESFCGSVVECPVCSANIRFPGQRRGENRPPVSFPPASSPASSSAPSAVENPEVSETRLHAEAAPSPPAPPREPQRPAPPASEKQALSPSHSSQNIELPLEEAQEPTLPPSPIYGAISIVTSVLAIITCVGSPIFAPIAIITGHTALTKARQSPIQPAPGHTLGAIGLTIGYVSLGITILILLAATFFIDPIRDFVEQMRQ